VDRACLGRPTKDADNCGSKAASIGRLPSSLLGAVETAAGPDDDYCRKYRIAWLLTLTKDGNRETAIYVRPNEAREPSTGPDRRKTHHGGPTNTS
jgi:hypothetical protein